MIPEPIESFWKSSLERARAVPLEAAVEKLREPAPYFVHRVTYRSFGGARITAYLATPIEGELANSRRLPAVITAPGYGGWEFGQMLAECQRGCIVMQIYPRDQGESGRFKRGEIDPGPGYLARGLEKPEGYYYQGAFLDLVRGLDYLATREDVDPNKHGAIGTSQGGGLVLGAAAIHGALRAVVAHVPFFCDIRNNPALPTQFPEMGTPQALATFDYFDPVSLATRLHAPTLLSTGGSDKTCPPESIHAVYDRLPGIKAIMHYPDLPHTSCGAFYESSWAWLRRYVFEA
jgi:cephalosporin-C deacetylase